MKSTTMRQLHVVDVEVEYSTYIYNVQDIPIERLIYFPVAELPCCQMCTPIFRSSLQLWMQTDVDPEIMGCKKGCQCLPDRGPPSG